MYHHVSTCRFSFDEKDSLQFSCVASSELGASEAKFNIIGNLTFMLFNILVQNEFLSYYGKITTSMKISFS